MSGLPSLKQEAFGGECVLDVHGYGLDGRARISTRWPVGPHFDEVEADFPTLGAAAAAWGVSCRAFDEWAKRATDAQILAEMAQQHNGKGAE